MGRRRSRVAKTGQHGMLFVVFSATLLTLMMLLAIPAKAQNTDTQYKSSKQTAQVVQGSGQQAQANPAGDDSQATDPAGETARITESTGNTIVDRITVPIADCDVASDASTVVQDNDDTRVTLTNGQNATITPDDDTLTIVGNGADGELTDLNPLGGNNQFGTERDTVAGEIVSSTGITCGLDAGSDNAGDDNNAADDNTGNGARTADELRDLSCEDLLVLFRDGGSNGQYGDAAALADPDVQARIEVCLREEIVEGTAADEDLPDTGGVSLIGVAVLGLVSAAAGLSVIRGGRRRG